MHNDVGISVIAGNTADTLDIFFQWATTYFDEINVVVQPNNFDDTLELCKHWATLDSVKLQVHEFDNFSAQFQRAIDMCTKPWCIQLGADEILDDFPYAHLPQMMERLNKKVGVFPRLNLQRDYKHFNSRGYPDYQQRLIKMNAGIGMDGKEVDETLNVNPADTVLLDQLPIIHFGHIRPEAALRQKGRDRKRFAAQDRCDGQQLKEVGIEWFIVRNAAWDANAKPLRQQHVQWIERWLQPDSYFRGIA